MKCVVFCVLAILSLALARPEENIQSRGCRYIMGRCVEECPVGTHAYTTGCNYLMPEATCAAPNPELDKRGKICDYSSCYCDSPTVRDEKTKQCVTVDKCSQPCPKGTYGYAIGCAYLEPEPTCSNPRPKKDRASGMICDFSDCYCNPPTVRDEVSKECVHLKDCPKKSFTSLFTRR